MKRAFVKRPVLGAVFLMAIATLGGCPIYSHDDDGCWRDRDCADGYLCNESSGVCYVADDGAVNGRCVRPSDCVANYTCNPSGQCVSGDCDFSGCVSGYHCDSSSGAWQCISNAIISVGGNGGGANSGVAGDSSGGGGAAQIADGGGAGSESSSDVAGSGGDAALVSSAGAGAGGEGG